MKRSSSKFHIDKQLTGSAFMPMTAARVLRSAGAVVAIIAVATVVQGPVAQAGMPFSGGAHLAPPPMIHGFSGGLRSAPSVHQSNGVTTHQNRGVTPSHKGGRTIWTGIGTTVIVPGDDSSPEDEESAEEVFENPPSGWVETENTLNHGTRLQKRELFAQLCKSGDQSSCIMASVLMQR
jgi:hypothetical protein